MILRTVGPLVCNGCFLFLKSVEEYQSSYLHVELSRFHCIFYSFSLSISFRVYIWNKFLPLCNVVQSRKNYSCHLNAIHPPLYFSVLSIIYFVRILKLHATYFVLEIHGSFTFSINNSIKSEQTYESNLLDGKSMKSFLEGGVANWAGVQKKMVEKK